MRAADLLVYNVEDLTNCVAEELGPRYAWSINTEPVRRAIAVGALRATELQAKIDSDEFWSKTVFHDGMTADLVRDELTDWYFVMDQLGVIYMELTGGKLSKHMYYAGTILSEMEGHMQDVIEENVEERISDIGMSGSDRSAVEQPCHGCGKALVTVNAWMEDGCPCNAPAGVNNLNLYRWKLLHDLQQQYSHKLASANQRATDLQACLDMYREVVTRSELADLIVSPDTDKVRDNDGPH